MLGKPSDARFKNRLVFVSGDVFCNGSSRAFGVRHFSKYFSARGGDAFDGGERAVRVDSDVHGRRAGSIDVLRGDLAPGGERGDHFVAGVKFPFSVGNRDAVEVT